jgi:probable F420-dependent oxidoreductase
MKVRIGLGFGVRTTLNDSAFGPVVDAVESLGWDSLWLSERIGGEAPDPLVAMAFAAGRTRRLKFGMSVMVLPGRNPVVLAKELATLDHLAAGRMLLGIGVGWLEEEFDAIGVPFAERGKRTDEYVAAMRALWTEDKASYHGEFVNFDECIMRPQPANGPIPVHVGGHTDIAARRAGRLGDGYFPGKGTHEELARTFDIVRTTAREHGRDPDAIEMTTGGNGAVGSGALDEVKALTDLGVARVIVPAFLFYRDTEAALARYGEEVISRT